MSAVCSLLRDWALARLLTRDQHALITALERPERWQPDEPLTEIECEQWAALLRTPLLRKLDIAMINWLQQEAQRAIYTPTPEAGRQCGFAAGARASWEIAKTFSRAPAASDGQSETDATTAAPSLAHLRP